MRTSSPPCAAASTRAHARCSKRRKGAIMTEDDKKQVEKMRRKAIKRLRKVDLHGGSHENLSAIAKAIYPDSEWGWTMGACAALVERLCLMLGDES